MQHTDPIFSQFFLKEPGVTDLESRVALVTGSTRGIGLGRMNRTRAAADVRVAPDGLVTLDDDVVQCDPVDSVSLSRLYFL